MKSLVFSSCLLVLLPTASAYADTPPVTPPLQVVNGPQPIAPMPNNPLANLPAPVTPPLQVTNGPQPIAPMPNNPLAKSPAPVTPGMIQASQAAASPAPTGPVAIVGDQVGLVPAKIPSNATIVHVQSQKQNQVQSPTSKNGNASTRSKNTPSQKIDATKNQSSSVKQKVGLPAKK